MRAYMQIWCASVAEQRGDTSKISEGIRETVATLFIVRPAVTSWLKM